VGGRRRALRRRHHGGAADPPDDAELIVRFHDRQSPESIYFRFFSPRPRLSERDLERFTNVDYVDRMAFVGLIGDELVGVARYDRHRGRSDAEVAFFIDDAHHGRGMATVLLEYLAAAAREAGISGFTASVLPAEPQDARGLHPGRLHRPQPLRGRGDRGGAGHRAHPGGPRRHRGPGRHGRSPVGASGMLGPSSIAVVGASATPGTIGHQVFRQLVSRASRVPCTRQP
jgi:GNAT superfamily N-acetyltransferase